MSKISKSLAEQQDIEICERMDKSFFVIMSQRRGVPVTNVLSVEEYQQSLKLHDPYAHGQYVVRFENKSEAEEFHKDHSPLFVKSTYDGLSVSWVPMDSTPQSIKIDKECMVRAMQESNKRSSFNIEYTGIVMPGVEMIAAERQGHFSREGWTAERDAKYTKGELARAAVAYTSRSYVAYQGVPRWWPWDRAYWKPGSAIRMLVKAGALIAAEIDRRLVAGEKP